MTVLEGDTDAKKRLCRSLYNTKYIHFVSSICIEIENKCQKSKECLQFQIQNVVEVMYNPSLQNQIYDYNQKISVWLIYYRY